MVSTKPGLIPQMLGSLLSNIKWGIALFVKHIYMIEQMTTSFEDLICQRTFLTKEPYK